MPSDSDTYDAMPSKINNLYGSGEKGFVDQNNNYIKTVLTIKNCVVTVNGTILIRGLLGAEGGILEGHTSGSHSQLINNGTLQFNNGSTLVARGYVKGSGIAYFNNGSNVYSPFVVRDFRGGTNTTTVFRKGGISPFNQYEMPNIQCVQIYYYGASHTAYVDLYASSKHNTDSITVIGSNGIIILKDGNSYLRKTYNDSKTTLTIIGNAEIGNLVLTVSGVDVKMSDVQFPLPWLYDINIGDGTTATNVNAPYDYKILTGCNVTVAQNATLTTNKSVIIYSTFTDTEFGGAVYPNKPAASFVVNGTYNINGSFGGNIQSNSANAKVVVSSSSTLTVTSKEGNSGDTKSWQALINIGKFTCVFTANETARFADGTALEKGKTYTYNGTSWNAA